MTWFFVPQKRFSARPKRSDEPIYALQQKKNFFDRLSPLQKLLNIWSSRDISIYGTINIVKTHAFIKINVYLND